MQGQHRTAWEGSDWTPTKGRDPVNTLHLQAAVGACRVRLGTGTCVQADWDAAACGVHVIRTCQGGYAGGCGCSCMWCGVRRPGDYAGGGCSSMCSRRSHGCSPQSQMLVERCPRVVSCGPQLVLAGKPGPVYWPPGQAHPLPQSSQLSVVPCLPAGQWQVPSSAFTSREPLQCMHLYPPAVESSTQPSTAQPGGQPVPDRCRAACWVLKPAQAPST